MSNSSRQSSSFESARRLAAAAREMEHGVTDERLEEARAALRELERLRESAQRAAQEQLEVAAETRAKWHKWIARPVDS